MFTLRNPVELLYSSSLKLCIACRCLHYAAHSTLSGRPEFVNDKLVMYSSLPVELIIHCNLQHSLEEQMSVAGFEYQWEASFSIFFFHFIHQIFFSKCTQH